MNKQYKILNLIDIPWYSGLSDYAFRQCEIFIKNGFETYITCPKESILHKKIIEKGYSYIFMSDRKKLLLPGEILKISKFIKEKNINIINAHTGRMQTLSYILSILNPSIKIIRTKADARSIKNSFTYSRVSALICGSRYIMDMCEKAKIKTKKYLIYAPVKLQNFTPPPSAPPYIISIVGRLDPVKGHKYFIEAALKILEIRNDIIFKIAGHESNIKWNDLEKLIAEKFKKYFEYKGYIDDVNEFMKNSHIGVISSISSEAFSRVAMEWLENARPIITTSVGCLGEFVDNKFIIPPKDSNAISQKILEILDLNKIKEIGFLNQQKAIKIFSKNNFETNLISIIKDIY